MDSSPGSKVLEPLLPAFTNTISPAPTGDKKATPSLLPAFEPLSSSPALPRPSKRPARSGSVASARLKYPTPVPTSSTGILSSSPPRDLHGRPSRAPLPQVQSAAAPERVPLGAVPSVELSENGETLTMGRSGTSSDYQLSNNRLISRVHVRARYVPLTASTDDNPLSAQPARIEIVCTGWNGLKVHCQGRTCELGKGDVFESKAENEDIMLDVQDARVLVRWPRRDPESLANLSDSSWDDSPRPARHNASGVLQSSPLRRSTRIESPVSPTPAGTSSSVGSSNALQILMPGGGGEQEDEEPAVQIYEDASADEQELPRHTTDQAEASFATIAASSFSSELSDPISDDENDPNEENDPIIHSFGPFGANLNNRLASFTTQSPKAPVQTPVGNSSPRRMSSGLGAASRALSAAAQARQVSKSKSATPVQGSPRVAPVEQEEVDLGGVNVPTITNHVINQLAFSRLSSNPLTTIMSNLPTEERKGLSKVALRHIIESAPCVGVIERQGKDAAGKPLESEYYYVPEKDDDEHRRAAVVNDLRKPSLRNCRKHHVQYYWKRPRTP
ncbi:Transcription factor Tos4 [Pleurostoma richardsiae]|uniref:Transcription factor Tos4 n=1 Tax=Pleurostoma richardsiae TaxID=41990 RepID=A0AA38RUM6_9PEZI|nr:Transcription factor Tos4 [Pleurostoma richardsiae]